MSHFNYNGPRMTYVRTRSGMTPAPVPERPRGPILTVVYYAPKPAWMDHIPGPFLRFRNRIDFLSYLNRTR